MDNIIEAAVERNEINIKDMIEATKNTVTHYVVNRNSARLVIRKIGFKGFCVVFQYNKGTEEWSVDSFNTVPDNIEFFISNWGEQLDSDKEFYMASKAYSRQQHGEIWEQ